jgi:hypothetical protein
MDSVKEKEPGQLHISNAIRTDCMQKHLQNKQTVFRFRFLQWYQDRVLLGYKAVQILTQAPTLRMKLLPPSSGQTN